MTPYSEPDSSKARPYHSSHDEAEDYDAYMRRRSSRGEP